MNQYVEPRKEHLSLLQLKAATEAKLESKHELAPTPPSAKQESKTVYHAICSEVKAAGAAPLYEGDPS